MSSRVALAHDWFVNRGGAERVAVTLASIFPEAPMFTAVAFPDASFAEVSGLDLRTSSLQDRIREPNAFRRQLMRYPAAWAALDASGFDAVIASTTAFAHHIRTDGCLIAYCHQPPRFIYDPSVARGLAPGWARPLLKPLLSRSEKQDRAAAGRVHRYVANSRVTAKRILDIYGVRATVVHPPVDTARFAIAPRTEDHWILVSRLLPHRDVALAIAAFRELGWKLVIVGEGPDRPRLERLAGDNIIFAGSVDDAQLAKLYGTARGAIVPGIEDLGLVALEANASGRPVVARARGGSLETIQDGATGCLFLEPTTSAVVRALRRAESMSFDAAALREHAMRFDREIFATRMREIVEARNTCLRCQRSSR